MSTLSYNTMFKSKIHRAVVTQCDLNYEGSCSIDVVLLGAAGILPYEQIHIVNVNNGERMVTYAIPAPPYSGIVAINGAGARLAAVGDLVVIMAYSLYTADASDGHVPTVVSVNNKNQIVAE